MMNKHPHYGVRALNVGRIIKYNKHRSWLNKIRVVTVLKFFIATNGLAGGISQRTASLYLLFYLLLSFGLPLYTP